MTSQKLSSSAAAWPVVIFLSGLALYALTLAPDVLWGGGDFARYQTEAYLLELRVEDGILGHPLWVISAHPFTWLPIRTVAWRANLSAAVFAAGALALTFLITRRLMKSNSAALLATAALAVSHTF
ncbi:MAG: protein O-mannosyl-transferase family [Thermoflexales bacterium]